MGSHIPSTPRTMGQGKFKEGVHEVSVTSLLLLHQPHYSRPFFLIGESEA